MRSDATGGGGLEAGAARPRLTPPVADTRRAVRDAIHDLRVLADAAGRAAASSSSAPSSSAPSSDRVATNGGDTPVASAIRGHSAAGAVPPAPPPAADAPLVLVALSGGADSLALAAATAFEAPRAGLRAGAVVVDHAVQPGSAEVAADAAGAARALGLDPVVVRRVEVGSAGGPEAAARDARYAALDAVADELDAAAVLLGHTLDDQAETVLLGLARGSGAGSLRGMAPVTRRYRRPFLGIRRAETLAACRHLALEPWHDPQNDDPAYTRVRVRASVLPLLELELGPGVAEALARTAEQLREDDGALDQMVGEVAEDLAEHIDAGIALPAAALEANPPAIRHRLIRLAALAEFGVSLTRAQTLEVARLAVDWHGQGPLHLPGMRVERREGRIRFTAAP